MAGHAMHETNAAAWAAMRAAQAAERKARKDARRAANRAAWWARYGMAAPEPVDADAVADAVADPEPEAVDPTPEPFELEAVEVPGDYVAFCLLDVPAADPVGFKSNTPSEGQGYVTTYSKHGLQWAIEAHKGGGYTVYMPEGDAYYCETEAQAMQGVLWGYRRSMARLEALPRFERGQRVAIDGRAARIVGVGERIAYTYGDWDAEKQREAVYTTAARFDGRGEYIQLRGRVGRVYADEAAADAA